MKTVSVPLPSIGVIGFGNTLLFVVSLRSISRAITGDQRTL
jgi:hypothetical protein